MNLFDPPRISRFVRLGTMVLLMLAASLGRLQVQGQEPVSQNAHSGSPPAPQRPSAVAPGDAFATLDRFLYQAFLAGSPSERLELNHIGAFFEPAEEGYRVTAVLHGYPAQQAGLRQGDLVVSADGGAFHPLWSFNAGDTAPELWTAAGRDVDLSYRRGGSDRSLVIRPVFENLYDSLRSATPASVVEMPMGNKLVGYVHLWSLSRNTGDVLSFLGIMASLSRNDGLIVDLRSSFGFLSPAHLRAFMRNPPETGGTSWPGPGEIDYFDKPMVLLVDGGTRAGAEILARQLAPLSRVETLGTATAGLPPDPEVYRQLARAADAVSGLHEPMEALQPERVVEYNPRSGADEQLAAAMVSLMELM